LTVDLLRRSDGRNGAGDVDYQTCTHLFHIADLQLNCACAQSWQFFPPVNIFYDYYWFDIPIE
jgi:hypothetical protein